MASDLTGIIVIEGADCSGKTSLAEELGGLYLHNGLFKNMAAAHMACFNYATHLAEYALVVIDRLFISEQVYGQVFRGGPAYDPTLLDIAMKHHNALTVLCVRNDQQAHLRHFEQMKGRRPERFDDIRQVVRLYADLVGGDLTKQGVTWLDDEIRYGQYAQRPDVMLYDMDRMNVEPAARLVKARLKGLQRPIKDASL